MLLHREIKTLSMSPATPPPGEADLYGGRPGSPARLVPVTRHCTPCIMKVIILRCCPPRELWVWRGAEVRVQRKGGR